jgi:trehalose 2-sulfotransferase
MEPSTKIGPDEAAMPSHGYLLCCIERTGSNLVTRALTGTGIAGRPIEYFNPVMQDKPRLRGILGDSNMVEGLGKIVSAGTTANGWFGAKIHWGHFRYLGMSILGEWKDSQRTAAYEMLQSRFPKVLTPSAACELLRPRFGDLSAQKTAYSLLQSRVPDLRVIWLRRHNMVARAISLFRALRTGLWHQRLSQSTTAAVERMEDFDFEAIHCLYCLGFFQEECWQRFFQEQKLSPYSVVYEELVADYESTMRGILRFLQLDGEQMSIPPLTSRKQSDALSEQWERRYRKSIAEGGI